MRPIFAVRWVFVLVILLPCSGVSLYATTIAFYSDGVIKAGDVYDSVEVYETPPAHTTVSMTGGRVGYPGMSTFDTSVVNISGGWVDSLQTNDSSTVNLSGYAFIDNKISLYNSSTLNFRGGAWEANGGYLVASDSSTVNVYDGIVGLVSMANFEIADRSTANIYGGAGYAPYVAYGSSTINIYDGRVNSLWAGESSVVNIYGGEIGYRWGFFIEPSASANIYGSGFIYDPEWRWYEDDPDWGTQWVSLFTGIGPNGVPIEITGMPDPFTSPNIRLIPEPSTFLLCALGGLWLVRKRKTARIIAREGGRK